MMSVSIRERATLFSYQFAICTDRRQLSNCFETALDFDFVSIVIGSIGNVETFTFVFTVKGLLTSLGHFDPYCLTREAHFHYVASSHTPLIRFLHFIHFYHNFGPHTRTAEAISVSTTELLELFHLHKMFVLNSFGRVMFKC